MIATFLVGAICVLNLGRLIAAPDAVNVNLVVQIQHAGLVKELAFSSDNALLATASWDGTVRLWTVPDRRLLRTFTGSGNQPQTVAFQPGSNLVASGDERGIRLWNPQSGTIVKSLDLEDTQQLAFLPNGGAIVIATMRGVFLWEFDRPVTQLSGDEARSIAVSPSGLIAASGNGNGSVHIYDLKSRQVLRTISDADDGWIWSVAFLPDGKLVSGGVKHVRVWDPDTRAQLADINNDYHIWHLSTASDGTVLVTTSGQPCIWNLLERRKAQCFDANVADFGAAVFSPDGQFVAASAPRPVIFDVRRGARIDQSKVETSLADLVAFSPNGRQLYSSDDSGVRLIDLDRGQSVWSIESTKSWDINSFAFSADSRRLFQHLDASNEIVVIDTGEGRVVMNLHPPAPEITRLAFLGASHQLVAGSTRGEILSYDLDRKAVIARQRVAERNIAVVATSPVNNSILVGSESGEWCVISDARLETRQCLKRHGKAEQGAWVDAGKYALLVESEGRYHSLKYDFSSGRIVTDYGATPPAVAASENVLFANAQLRLAGTDAVIQTIRSDRGVEMAAISRDGNLLGLLDLDGQFSLRQVGRDIIKLDLFASEKLAAFAFCSSDGSSVAFIDSEGQASLYSPLAGLTRLFATRSGRFHRAIACSADDRYVAVSDETALHVWDRNTRTEFIVGERLPSEAGILAVAPDGSELLTEGNHDAYLWHLAEPTSVRILEGSGGKGRVSAAVFDPGKRFIVTGDFDGRLKLWRPDAHGFWKSTAIVDAHKYTVSALVASRNGRVASIDAISHELKMWEVADQSLISKWTVPDTEISQVFAFNFSADDRAVHVSGRYGGVNSRSESGVTPLIGLNGVDANTGAILPSRWHMEEEFVSATPDPAERLAAVTANSGWISLLDMRTGERLARVVPGSGAFWMVVGETGRFDSLDVAHLPTAYWQFSDDPLRLYSADLTMRDYYEPRLLARLLTCHAAEAVGRSNACNSAFRPVRPLPKLNRVLPIVRILPPRPSASAQEMLVDVEVSGAIDGSQPNGKTVTDAYDLRLFRNGQLVGQWPEPPEGNLGSTEIADWRKLAHVPGSDGERWVRHTFRVNLASSDRGKPVGLTAYAFNEDRIKSETVTNESYRVPSDITPRNPRAFVLSIGINQYHNALHDLQFAVKDAQVMARTLQSIRNHRVVTLILTSDTPQADAPATDQATRANIRAALALLAGHSNTAAESARLRDAGVPAAILEQWNTATPDDALIITYSGHGHTEPTGAFYLLPSGSWSGESITATSLANFISSAELSAWLRAVDAGEIALIIDACHAGASVETPEFKPGPMGDQSLGQLAYDKGMRILAASQADDEAVEIEALQEGLLTYALVHKGLQQHAPGTLRVSAGERESLALSAWLKYGELQTPQLYFDALAGRVTLVSRGSIVKPEFIENRQRAAQTPVLFDFQKREERIFLGE